MKTKITLVSGSTFGFENEQDSECTMIVKAKGVNHRDIPTRLEKAVRVAEHLAALDSSEIYFHNASIRALVNMAKEV